MAIYQGGRGMAFQGGGNSMFSQMSEALQRTQEVKQAEREQAFLDKLNANASAMGKISSDFSNQFSDDGHLQVGSSKSWKQHYEELSGGKKNAREMRRAFGRKATPDQIQNFFKNKTDERDKEILSSITRRMQELGTSNIYKVIPKDNEKGGKEFRQWYNNITNPEIRDTLLKMEYTPGQEDKSFVPEWMEKRMAQGKSTDKLAIPAGLAVYGAVKGGQALAPMVKDSGMVKWAQKKFGYNPGEARQLIRSLQTGAPPKNLQGKINAKNKLIERLSNQKKKLSARDARRLGQAKRFVKQFEGAQKDWRKSSRDILKQASKGKIVGGGLGLLGQVGGYNIGQTLAEQVTDNELAQSAAGFAGAYGVPKIGNKLTGRAIARWAPRLLANAGWLGGPKGRALTGLLSLGLGAGLDYMLDDNTED